MYRQILVPIDLNEEGFSEKAVEVAVWHAKHSNAELHLLYVLPGIHLSMVANYLPADARARMRQDIKQQLNTFADEYIDETVVYKVHVAEGKTYTTILDQAEILGADLIVLPSHKRSQIDKVMLGSVAEKVVQFSPINVLVVKPQEYMDENFRNLLD